MSTRAVVGKKLFETMLQIKVLMEQLCEGSFEDKVASILQFQALSFLVRNPNATNSELADHLKISASSSAQLADRLFKSELIERQQDEKDRRMVRLNVTKKGITEVEILKEKMYQRVEEVFSCLSQEDLQEFLRIHQVLLENLEKKYTT